MVDGKLAVILARGGSKRVPRKNIIDFGGKPMLAWSVEAALRSECFERVLVSTDDPEIAEIAIKYGADVPFLRLDATDDFALSSEATICALLQAENYWKISFNTVAQLMANCPLRNSVDVANLMAKFESSDGPSQISVFPYGFCNPWWALEISGDGKPKYNFPEARQQRSQDLPQLYCPTGAMWISKKDNLLNEKTFYCKSHTVEPISWISALDIDDYHDLDIAKICLKHRQNINTDLA